jgi:protocatechuate 3,4-dioxygenase beta subunit
MSQLAQDLAQAVDRRRVLGGIVLGVSGAALAACGTRATAQSGDSRCVPTPTEIRGPYPADGRGGRGRPINVLDLEGIVRRDIRSSFAGLQGTAEGVPLELELQLASPGNCTPLAGRALYLWQNDAAGEYSLYTLRDVNYLRGMQEADDQGRVRFTMIVPGCYGGRFPHCHLEVFADAAAAARGDAALLVSQLGYPAEECRGIYRSDARYGDSIQNLERLPMARDLIFADSSPEDQARQTIVLTGNAQQGYRGTATVVVA